jgi:hypothetical protein
MMCKMKLQFSEWIALWELDILIVTTIQHIFTLSFLHEANFLIVVTLAKKTIKMIYVFC